jgi:hypothetical protein
MSNPYKGPQYGVGGGLRRETFEGFHMGSNTFGDNQKGIGWSEAGFESHAEQRRRDTEAQVKMNKLLGLRPRIEQESYDNSLPDQENIEIDLK